MTCRAHREAILDASRGVQMPSAVAGAAEAHLRECAACSAELERQRHLTRGLQALAAAALESTPAADLEGRLLGMFVAAPRPSAPAGPRRHQRAAGWWLGAAAAVAVLTTGILAFWQQRSQVPAGGMDISRAEPGPAAPARGQQDASRFESPRPLVQPSAAPAAARNAVTRRTGSRAGERVQVRPVEFMLIPAAAGLPALESASIVRMELPLSALPGYGVAIAPDAAGSAVQADLLVGQDGQARGIRLVTTQQEPSASIGPRSRQ
jgi:hypothetical protein